LATSTVVRRLRGHIFSHSSISCVSASAGRASRGSNATRIGRMSAPF